MPSTDIERLEATNAGLCPPTIEFGKTIQCSIDNPSEVDTYTFTANANDKVLVRMSRAEGSLLPGIRVYDSDGSLVCEENGTYSVEIASCDLEAGGTVTILAYDSYVGIHTGPYNLSLTCLTPPCDPPYDTDFNVYSYHVADCHLNVYTYHVADCHVNVYTYHVADCHVNVYPYHVADCHANRAACKPAQNLSSCGTL